MKGLLPGATGAHIPRQREVMQAERKDHVNQDYDFKAVYRNQGNMKGLLPGASSYASQIQKSKPLEEALSDHSK